MLLRANVLAKGLSGARPVVAERLCDLLNHHVYPAIPCRGSVGASGDLAPLAHLALVLIGEGDLSQNLGYPRQYDHPAVVEAMTAIRRICSENGVACGHPHVDAGNAQKVLDEGYRFVMSAPGRTLTFRGNARAE